LDETQWVWDEQHQQYHHWDSEQWVWAWESLWGIKR
jgi:hypothetical protein